MHGKKRSCFAKQKLSPTAAAAKAARDLEVIDLEVLLKNK